MAIQRKTSNGAKIYNRDVELSPGSAYKQGGDYVSIPVTFAAAANADNVDQFIFTAQRRLKVVGASEVHTVAGTDAGTVTLDLKKCSSGTAPASGTSVLAAAFNAKGTAATPQIASLSATEANLILEAGQSLAVDYTGTITSLAGVLVTVDLIPA